MTGKILMCNAEYYRIKYEINPWTNVNVQVDNSKAKEQWQNLYKILKDDLKTDVMFVKPREDVPDMVFTANAALVYKNNAFISRFKYPQRQPEEEYFAQWFFENGYKVHRLPDYMSFEGAGDALFLGERLYSGYIPRSDFSAHTYISEIIGVPVLSLELVNPCFYHLDTCFCPLEGGYLIYYPKAFDEYANIVIESNVPKEKRITVDEEEASCFACNAVNIGKNVVTNFATQRFTDLLAEKGFNHIQVDLSEFIKAGGSAKCLTLKV